MDPDPKASWSGYIVYTKKREKLLFRRTSVNKTNDRNTNIRCDPSFIFFCLFIYLFSFYLFIFPHFSRNYVVIVPTQFSFGKDLEIFVQMLNPVSYETVQAKLEDGANKTIATGSLTLNSGEYTNLDNSNPDNSRYLLQS